MPAEAEPENVDKLVGQTLASRYLIESRIGEGAMGTVYRAKHVKVGRAFAVKLLHPRLLEDPKQLARFEREAELAGRLRHPNVIGVVDVGEAPDGLRYMVMDFAEGPDLATLLSEAPMTARRVIQLTRQLLEGLFHAHEQGLIHRDFKPENVIVERDSHNNEVPRIVDFGIAILREGGESAEGPGRLTTNGLVLGTPHYMAPEQAVADPIDHRIDLFALGIMVYEMLSGKLPFDGTGAEVARANLLLDPPLISERVPYLEVDPLLEAFARKLMAKKRDLRPATAKVARDLLDLIEKDRSAAAAALGVPLDVARGPMTTQPNQPVRPSGGDGTFPPPIRQAIETPPQAPPMTAPAAVRSGEHALSTEQTDALATKKRRAPLIGAIIVGVGIVSGAAVVVLTKNKDKAPTTEQVAQQDPNAAVVPTPPVPQEPANAGTNAGTGSSDVATPPTAGGGSGELSGVGSGEAVGTAAIANAGGSGSGAGSAAAKSNVAAKQTKTKTVVKTPANPAAGTSAGSASAKTASTGSASPPAPVVLDTNALAARYGKVGNQLKELELAKGRDAVSDLWATYRRIRWSEASATQAAREETASILTKLTSDIAARKK
jgi:eukaryotic-like serine/threonine-protein kinase